MNFHAHYAGISEPVETCLVGSGSFGRSYLAQSRRTRLVNARIAVDVTAEAAGRAFAAAGFEPREIALCQTAAEAKAAWNAGKCVAAASLDAVMELPFALLSDADEALCTRFAVIKEKKLYGKLVRGIERSTFVIDANGVLRREWRGVKAPGHAQEVLEFVRTL